MKNCKTFDKKFKKKFEKQLLEEAIRADMEKSFIKSTCKHGSDACKKTLGIKK